MSGKSDNGKKILLMKATLTGWGGDTSGKPYRVIAIPEDFTLYQLAMAIVDSFNFDFDHSFGFYNNIKQWTNSTVKYELHPDFDAKGVESIKVKEVFNRIRRKVLFLFDYGDSWYFVVELVGREKPEENVKYPMVKESVGESPKQYWYAKEEE